MSLYLTYVASIYDLAEKYKRSKGYVLIFIEKNIDENLRCQATLCFVF